MSTQDHHTFYNLTPQRILEAVEEAGVRCTGRILQLNSMENRVYEVEIETQEERSRYDRFRVVKFYRPERWSLAQIEEEHQFLFDLKAQDIGVVIPELFPSDKKSIHSLKSAEEKTEILFSVFPKVGGRTLDELDDRRLERMGRLLARLHLVGASKPVKHRLGLNVEVYGRESLAYLMSQSLLPESLAERFRLITEQICALCENRLKGVAVQRIHGDLHCGNVLWDGDNCMLVDFDDMLRGPCVQDLWLLIPGRDEEDRRKWEVLLSGYEQLRNFDRNELFLVESLRVLRIIYFMAWIARRWSDPAFPRVFPSFGTLEYWREQLVGLEEQYRILIGVTD